MGTLWGRVFNPERTVLRISQKPIARRGTKPQPLSQQRRAPLAHHIASAGHENTLCPCPYPQCEDQKLEQLYEALKKAGDRTRASFPSAVPLVLHSSVSYLGFFISDRPANLIREFAMAFASEASVLAGRQPHKRLAHTGEQGIHATGHANDDCSPPAGASRGHAESST